MANTENLYQDQVIGPFSAGEDIMAKIKAQASTEGGFSTDCYVWHLGIKSDTNTIFNIKLNDSTTAAIPIKIGSTGIYEIGNTKVVSIIPQQNVDDETIIDFVLQA